MSADVSASECKHGLDPRWCATCKHGPVREQPWRATADALGEDVTIAAKHPGRCRVCSDTIEPGDRISLQERDGETRWVCGGCA
jgi:hypothetical protein